jgi:hypothetical protein
MIIVQLIVAPEMINQVHTLWGSRPARTTVGLTPYETKSFVLIELGTIPSVPDSIT